LTASVCAPTRRFSLTVIIAAWATVLAACSSSSPSTITGPQGTSNGVTINVSTGLVPIQQGTQTVLTATVLSDPTNAGVTWTLSGQGQLVNETSTKVTYQAPSAFAGTVTSIITATANADHTQTASSPVTVLGAPLMNPIDLFPANVGTIYTTQLGVSGGLAPYAWVISAGTLPPGIALTASTGNLTTLTGTPTTVGVYKFSVKVTDKNSATSSVDLTLVIKAAAACVIEGQYASVFSGFYNGAISVGASSINISSTGTITGYHDFNPPGGPVVSETLTGTCQTRTSNNGLLTITGLANSPVYSFAVTTGLRNGRLQLVNGGSSQSGTAALEQQQPADFSLTKLAGDFAFGALGAQSDGSRAGIAGNLSLDAGGAITGGYIDSNDSAPITDAVLAGTLSAPDANGHGTMTLIATISGGTRTLHFAYYIVTADRVFIASTDTGFYASGFMTRRIGAFSNASLVNPGILSLWGAQLVFSPKTVMSMGRFSGANPTAGKINLVLDTADINVNTYAQAINGVTYAVRADGRTTLSYTSAGTTRNFVLYLTGPATGYLIEQGSASGNAGIIEAQAPGPFSTNIPGLFVSGMQYPEDEAPIVLLPAVRLSSGAFNTSAGQIGYFTMDSATGRGVGALTVSGIGVGTYTFYIVRPDKVLALRMSTLYTSAGLAWMTSD
jgi:hypothetical protein